MPIVCPACRASNEQGPNCRRCKSDLGLLFDLESQRQAMLDEVRSCIQRDEFPRALQLLDSASLIRSDAELIQLRAIIHLLLGEFGMAWHQHRLATA